MTREKIQGRDVLEATVRWTWGDGLGDRVRGISSAWIAGKITGVSDGRKISAIARKLASAGLITVERRGDTTFLKPTERGLEVDAMLERITAARGGSFQPWNETDLTTTEKLVLH